MAPTTSSARVVLINPPPLPGRTNERTFSGGIGVSRKLKPFEKPGVELLPIDLLYLAAVAEKANASVELIDLLLDAGADPHARCVAAALREKRPRTFVGVRVSMPSLPQDLSFAGELQESLPDCRVFVFGAAIMTSLDHWISTARVDFALYGEPEAFFDQVLAAEDPLEVPGVISPRRYQPLRGAELYDRARAEARQRSWVRVRDVATLPRPAWHLLDLPRYAKATASGEVAAYVQASRGCPIACTMCPYVLTEGEAWRRNDVERVVDEIELLNRYGITRVRFRDPNFGFNRKYAVALAEALAAREVKLSATVETSLEVFDEPALEKLHRAGIRTITTGVETNDPACMSSIGQKIKVNDKLRERVEACRRIGFHVYGTYCLGMPEETWDSVERTWRFALELDVESGFTVLTPFPGTPMYWRAIEEGLLPRDMQFARWNSYTATARSYALTTTDLDMARWWARMETILPYRRKRAAASRTLLRFYARHLPHYAWRTACRAYVWLRRRVPASRAFRAA